MSTEEKKEQKETPKVEEVKKEVKETTKVPAEEEVEKYKKASEAYKAELDKIFKITKDAKIEETQQVEVVEKANPQEVYQMQQQKEYDQFLRDQETAATSIDSVLVRYKHNTDPSNYAAEDKKALIHFERHQLLKIIDNSLLKFNDPGFEKMKAEILRLKEDLEHFDYVGIFKNFIEQSKIIQKMSGVDTKDLPDAVRDKIYSWDRAHTKIKNFKRF